MKPFVFLLFSVGISFNTVAQELTAAELLDKSIAYHDPSGAWKQFKGLFTMVMQDPDGHERISEIRLDFSRQYYKGTHYQNGDTIEKTWNKGECMFLFNGSKNFDEITKKRNRLSCESVLWDRDYYTYLLGLPMKLKDPGTLIDPLVQIKNFMGKKALVLKVNYTEEVGKDTWYFYFNPETFALQAYQFFHEEAKNDGEYILLSDEGIVNGIKMAKNRAWYFNKNGELLGTDILK